jgi:hypothetical protein
MIAFGVVVLTLAIFIACEFRPASDGRTLEERRQIAEACLTMLHSSLTNEVDGIKVDDQRIPVVIRALNPHHIEVIPDSAVEIYRIGKPEVYFLMRTQQPTNTWILFIAGPSVGRGGGREILRLEHD